MEIVEKKKELGATLNQSVAGLRYLHHLGVETLTHFCSSVGQQHRAVSVDVNQSSCLKKRTDSFVKCGTNHTKQGSGPTATHLIEENSSEADAEFSGDDCEAAFGPSVLPNEVNMNKLKCRKHLLC